MKPANPKDSMLPTMSTQRHANYELPMNSWTLTRETHGKLFDNGHIDNCCFSSEQKYHKSPSLSDIVSDRGLLNYFTWQR